MAVESIELTVEIPARPERVFRAWMSSKEHSAFTSSDAKVDATAGGRHSAYGGYIHGWVLSVNPSKRRFVQAWRTTEFSPEHPDSVVSVKVSRAKGGATVSLSHTDIPEGQGARYLKGWDEFYFEPLKKYFSAPPKPRKAAKKAAEKVVKKASKKASKKAPKEPAVEVTEAEPKKTSKKSASKKSAKKASKKG